MEAMVEGNNTCLRMSLTERKYGVKKKIQSDKKYWIISGGFLPGVPISLRGTGKKIPLKNGFKGGKTRKPKF